jgi:hypothetical protein
VVQVRDVRTVQRANGAEDTGPMTSNPGTTKLAEAARPFVAAVLAEDHPGRDFADTLRAIGGRISIRQWRALRDALAATEAATHG